MTEVHPWELDVGRLRRAQAVHSIMLQVIIVLLVLVAGAVAGLATANIATRDVVRALAAADATGGPMSWDQYRTLHSVTEYYTTGASTYHAGVLGVIGSVFLVLALAVRRRLVPDGIGRRRLAVGLAAVAAAYVLLLVVADPFGEIGRRVALERHLLLPASTVWNDAVETSFLMQVPLAGATLALALAVLTPRRIVLSALGVVTGIGYAIVLLCKLPVGPLARPAEPPAAFLDGSPRAVRVAELDAHPRVVRGVLPDVGLSADPPPVGPDAERAAEAAERSFGLDDLRGATAARLLAFEPLARFAPDEHARRLAALYARTTDATLLDRLAAALRGNAPRSPAAETALAAFADSARVRVGSAGVDVCRTRVARGELTLAARVKDAARADGVDERALADCVVAPPPPEVAVAGRAVVDGSPAAGVAIALLDADAAGRLDADAAAHGTFDLSLLAGAATVRTDASGAWRIDHLPPGRYRLLVLLDDPRRGPDRSVPPPPDWIEATGPGPFEAPTIALTARLE